MSKAFSTSLHRRKTVRSKSFHTKYRAIIEQNNKTKDHSISNFHNTLTEAQHKKHRTSKRPPKKQSAGKQQTTKNNKRPNIPPPQRLKRTNNKKPRTKKEEEGEEEEERQPNNQPTRNHKPPTADSHRQCEQQIHCQTIWLYIEIQSNSVTIFLSSSSSPYFPRKGKNETETAKRPSQNTKLLLHPSATTTQQYPSTFEPRPGVLGSWSRWFGVAAWSFAGGFCVLKNGVGFCCFCVWGAFCFKNWM